MSSDNINIISFGYVAPEGMSVGETGMGKTDDNVIEILKNKKQNKLLSKQDKLALKAAHQAWSKVDIPTFDSNFSMNTGIYFCVGTLPFEDAPLDRIVRNSEVDNKLSYSKFSSSAYESLNPMLTFKCLPNMPLFHISFNLGIQGPYFMTYPGVLEFGNAMKRAIRDLNQNKVEFAILGAACDQDNFLVQHHLKRTNTKGIKNSIDCAACFVLTKNKNFKPMASIKSMTALYNPINPLETKLSLGVNDNLNAFTGPVEPLLYACLNLESSNRDIDYQWNDSNKNQLNMRISCER